MKGNTKLQWVKRAYSVNAEHEMTVLLKTALLITFGTLSLKNGSISKNVNQ